MSRNLSPSLDLTTDLAIPDTVQGKKTLTAESGGDTLKITGLSAPMVKRLEERGKSFELIMNKARSDVENLLDEAVRELNYPELTADFLGWLTNFRNVCQEDNKMCILSSTEAPLEDLRRYAEDHSIYARTYEEIFRPNRSVFTLVLTPQSFHELYLKLGIWEAEMCTWMTERGWEDELPIEEYFRIKKSLPKKTQLSVWQGASKTQSPFF